MCIKTHFFLLKLVKYKKLLYTIWVQMEVKMENIKEIKIKVEGKKWEEAMEKAYKKASSNFQVDGFRKGHAPKNVFLKKYTQERLNFDCADICLDDAYNDMIKNSKYTANKELMIIPDAVHTDLYDRVDIIPFEKLEEFFNNFLK